MQISNAIPGKMYSFLSRWIFKGYADDAAKAWIDSTGKHAYVTKVSVKGSNFYDVRLEN